MKITTALAFGGVSSVVLAISLTAEATGSRVKGIPYGGDPGMVTTVLSADRVTYYVGEPVRLTLTVRNEHHEPLVGFFAMVGGKAEVRYRRAGEVFAILKAHSTESDWPDSTKAPMVLDPGQEYQSEAWLAMDRGAGRLVLEEVGENQFQVVLWPAPEHPDRILKSSLVTVEVAPVPPAHRDAFAEYSAKNLAALVQSPVTLLKRTSSIAEAAIEFLDRYPRSPYSDPLRRQLGQALRARLQQNVATEEERALYQRLKEIAPRE